MKTKLAIALMTVVGALAITSSAQDNQPQNDGPPTGGPGGQHGPGMGQGQRPPLPAVVRALDANHDGVIDADEIATASIALKSLDKNGDGKLTMDEYMGPRPQMRGGKPGGQGRGPAGFGGGPGGEGNLPPNGPPQGDGDGGFPPAGGPPGQN